MIDVVKDGNLNSSESNFEEQEETQRRSTYYSHSRVSEMMIAQFFKEVEGPDRDWGKDYDYEDFYEELNHKSQQINESNSDLILF